MRHSGSRKRRVSIHSLLFIPAIFAAFGLLLLTFRSVDPSITVDSHLQGPDELRDSSSSLSSSSDAVPKGGPKSCATVEEMGEDFNGGFVKESLRVRQLVRRHFAVNGKVLSAVYQPDCCIFFLCEGIFMDTIFYFSIHKLFAFR